jgi:hypothetical protein
MIALSASNIGISTAVNGTEVNLSTAYGGLGTVTLSLPGSAPTTAPKIQFYVGEATTKKRLLYQATGSTVSGDYPMDFVCDFPTGTMFANVTVTGGATSAITAEAYLQELTTI